VVRPGRELNQKERALLRRIVSANHIPDREILLGQLETARVVRGPLTFLELQVAQSAASASVADGLLRVTATVEDGSGQPTGELLVWVTAGKVSALEYAWFSDDPPIELPSLEDIRFSSPYA
jgi:hypothetical protein